MSQPEWMQKFKEIGQKSQRVDSDGNVIVESLDDKFKKPPPVANSSVPEWLKKKQEKSLKETTTDNDADDDAAALFAKAASTPAVIKVDTSDDNLTTNNNNNNNTIEEGDDEDAAALFFGAAGSKPAVTKTTDDEVNDTEKVNGVDDAAALFAAAGGTAGDMKVDDDEKDAVGGLTGEEQDMVTKYQKMLKMGMLEGAVVQKMEVEEVPKHVQDAVLSPPPTEEPSKEPEETGVAGVVASSSPTDGEQKMSDDDFGGTWVVDKEKILDELDSTKFEEVEVNRDTGNVHFEEVYLDENGNEIVVQRDGDGEGEIFVDEDGNEIEYEEEEEEEVVEEDAEGEVQAIASQEREIKDEELLDKPVEAPYDPDYDVENQLKLLNRRSKAYRSRMAPWVPYLFLFSLMAAAIIILFFVVLAEDDGVDPRNFPTAAPTPNYLPLGPTNTGAIAVSATTSLDPVTGNCDFIQTPQPHVIDQCNCTGSISIIADDIRERYQFLLETFMPSVIPDFDQAIDSCDASNQALVWLSSGINNAGEAPDSIRRDRYALAYFYMGQGGVNWTDNKQWLSVADACEWDRVSCDEDGHVVSLDVSSNGINGQLSSAISLMENIESFSVARNELVGTIPPEILATPKLRSLDLSFNSLAGELPSFPSSSTLQMINLASNDLSGVIHSTIGNMEALSSLDLRDNGLQGKIPSELFSLPLVELFIASNALNGTIPDGIGDLTNLEILTLGPNKFTGEIPTTIYNLSNLTQLVVEEVPDLSGRLPAEYGIGLTNLVQFILSDTNVTGIIPPQFGLMTALETLNLARNSLGRAIPTELGLLTNLKVLNLEDNAFSGTLPTEIGNAIELIELRLQVNQISGTIPSSIGRMSNLVTLNLDGNFFGSRAPEEICNLRQENLNDFTVDCPQRLNDVVVVGVICTIPSCCTECF